MVSEKKKRTVKELREELRRYSVIGILDMFKLPARQLHDIRNKLRGIASIRMVKKRVLMLTMKEAGIQNLENLEEYIQGEPALLLSNENPFRLARIIETSKSGALAKEGDVAPRDITVMAGPTNLAPGPVIGEFQRAKIPAGVEGEKIVVKQDTVVAKEGSVIEKATADILAKLGVEPMEIGLSLLSVWESGLIYPKEILFIPREEYIEKVRTASSEALNLSININYFTPENISLLLSRANREALSLAGNAGIVTPGTVGLILSKAGNQAKALEALIK